MLQHDGVVVRVHDPRVRGDLLRHLVGVAGHRQPGADVQELADAALGGQVTHHPGQERPVRPHVGHDPRVGGDRLLGRLPVRGEVVLTAQPVVVDPGRVSMAGIELRHILPGHTGDPSARH